MKNYFKSILAIAVLCVSVEAYSMSANYGFIATYNYAVNGGKYKNNGTVSALNNITLKTTSLSGNGSLSASNNADITSDHVDYTGAISAGNDCKIKAKKFEGSAMIQAPTITVTCDEFNFTGSMACDKQCTIYAKQAFDTGKFTRSGAGAFKVVISPYDIEFLNARDLCAQSCNDLGFNGVQVDEDALVSIIKKIRARAALNDINDKDVLNEIKKNLEARVNFHRERLTEQTDRTALHIALAKCGTTVLGLLAASKMFKHEPYLREKFKADSGSVEFASFVVAALSVAAGATSYSDFYNWRNPKHQEKHEHFSRVVQNIEDALVTERVVEELVITL